MTIGHLVLYDQERESNLHFVLGAVFQKGFMCYIWNSSLVFTKTYSYFFIYVQVLVYISQILIWKSLNTIITRLKVHTYKACAFCIMGSFGFIVISRCQMNCSSKCTCFGFEQQYNICLEHIPLQGYFKDSKNDKSKPVRHCKMQEPMHKFH